MEKRLYGKPLMGLEQFTPSEYVSICWYLDDDCLATLYHDDNGDERYNYLTNPGENKYGGTHSSHARIPSEPKPYFSTKKGDPSPTSVINDQRYYTGYTERTEWIMFVIPVTICEYTSGQKVTGDIYSYNDGTTTHYFQDYHTDGNHS